MLREGLRAVEAAIGASPRLRRASLAFAPTRPLARRRARDLFDLGAGFVHAQVLQAFVSLELPDRLAGGARGLATLSRETGVPASRLERLLEAAASLGLAGRAAARDGEARYRLGRLGAPLARNPALAAMIAHHALLYRDLADPVALLRAPMPTLSSRFWRYDPEAGEAGVRAYTALMSLSVELVADDLIASRVLARSRRLVEIGGGDAALATRLARAHPRLRITSCDLPAVSALARARLAREGGRPAIAPVGLDIHRDGWPTGADTVLLARVLHDHDDGPAMGLLARACACLPPGGRIVIAEPMRAMPGAERISDAYFGPYLLAMGSGRPRRRDEIGAMLRAAGFASVRAVAGRSGLAGAIVTARVRTAP